MNAQNTATQRPQSLRSRLVLLALLGLILALAGDAFWWEPSSIRTTTYRLNISGAADAGISGLRIAVIADLHAGAPYIDVTKIQRVVTLANAAKPDLILLVGDYVAIGSFGEGHIPIETIAAQLRGLHAPLGVFAVLGNHDNWENGPHIAQTLQQNGIRVLENRAIKIARGTRSFELVGIGDTFSYAALPDKAFSGFAAKSKSLCFTHSPDIVPFLPNNCVLTIAGHTHGGQVWLPIFGRLIVPSRYGQRFAAGFLNYFGKPVFVSTGIGTSILPVRFLVPPEVTILEIR